MWCLVVHIKCCCPTDWKCVVSWLECAIECLPVLCPVVCMAAVLRPPLSSDWPAANNKSVSHWPQTDFVEPPAERQHWIDFNRLHTLSSVFTWDMQSNPTTCCCCSMLTAGGLAFWSLQCTAIHLLCRFLLLLLFNNCRIVVKIGFEFGQFCRSMEVLLGACWPYVGIMWRKMWRHSLELIAFSCCHISFAFLRRWNMFRLSWTQRLLVGGGGQEWTIELGLNWSGCCGRCGTRLRDR